MKKLICVTVLILMLISPLGVYASEEQEYNVSVPILMFHRVMHEIENPTLDITPDRFRELITALIGAGFTPVSFAMLEEFVAGEANLPSNPFVITFDDGYLCNFELAFPILLEMNVPANINIIGIRRGESTYMGRPSTPHFTWEHAYEMVASGLIEIGSHSYNMHGAPGITQGRVGLTKLPYETEERFALSVADDINTFHEQYYYFFGKMPRIFAYPFGWASDFTEQILAENGYTITLFTSGQVSVIKRYNPASLFGLSRINVNGNFTAGELIQRMMR